MEKKPTDFDDFLEKYAGFSRFQMFLCAGAFYLAFSTSALSQIAIFLSGVPDFRCAIPNIDSNNCNITENEIKNRMIPINSKTDKYETCVRYDINTTSCDIPAIGSDTGTITCQDGYYYDYSMFGETTITLWNLVCDRSLLDAMATAIFFAGFFVGSCVYGPMSDWYGRKLPLIVNCLSFMVIVVAIGFIPIFEVYVVMRFFAGAATIAAFVAAFTYVNEIAPKKYRTLVSFLCFESGAVAHAILPGLAFATKNWRLLEAICGSLPFVFIFIYCFMKESPGWLIAVGREDEAQMIMEKFARSNKNVFTDEEWSAMVQNEKNKMKNISSANKKKYSILDLFKYPRTRIVTLAVMLNWFTVSLVFYGLSLNVGNLSGDPYVNAAINAAIEIAGTAMVLLAPFVEKRIMLAFAFLFCGICCLVSTICIEVAGENKDVENLGVALAMIGKFGISGAFVLTYSTTSDAFPTVVRGTGISVGSMAARIGSIITPFTIELQKEVPWLTQTLFGCLSVFTFFSSIILPKSSQPPSLTLIEEAEEYYKESMTTWNRFVRFNFIKKRRGSISERNLSKDFFDNTIL